MAIDTWKVRFCLLTLIFWQGENILHKNFVWGNITSSYIQSISVKSLQSYGTNLAQTWRRLVWKFRQGTDHCRVYKPETATNTYSPCGQVMFNSAKDNTRAVWKMHSHNTTGINITFQHVDLADSIHQCASERLGLQCDEAYTPSCGRLARFDYICHMNTVTATYFRSNQLAQSLTASKIQFIYQVYHAPSYARHLKYIHDLSPNKTFLLPRMNGTIDMITKKKGWLSVNIPDSTPNNDVILTLVTMVTYQWVVMMDDIDDKDVVARDGPFHMSPILLPIAMGYNLFGYKSSGHVITVMAATDRSRAGRDSHRPFVSFLYHRLGSGMRFNSINVAHGREYHLSDVDHAGTPFYLDGLTFSSSLPYQSFLKVTITGVKNAGFSSGDCRFWGLAIFERDRFQERVLKPLPPHALDIKAPIFLMCKLIFTTEDTMEVAIPKEYYSKTSDLNIIWYSYAPRSNAINITIKVEPTHCSGAVFYCGNDIGSGYQRYSKYLWSVTYAGLPMLPISRLLENEMCDKKQVHTRTWLNMPRCTMCISEYGEYGVFNSVAVNVGVPCLVLQHFPIFQGTTSKSCYLYLPTTLQLTTFKTIHRFWAEKGSYCVPLLHKNKAGNDIIEVDPRCAVMQVVKSVSTYPVKVSPFKPSLTWADLKASDMETQSHHFSVNLNHRLDKVMKINDQLTESYSYSVYSHQIWRFLFVKKIHNFVSWTNFSVIMENVTMVTLQSNNVKSCVELDIFYTTPAPVEYLPRNNMVIVHRQQLSACFNGTSVFKMVSMNTYMYRKIVINKPPSGFDSLTMEINPFVPLEQMTSYRKHHTTLDYGLNDYYVIWQSKKLSWIEANKMCDSVGGSIIKGSTQEEIALVEQLILGIPFGSEKPPLPSPVRFHPYTGVFISQV